MSAVIKTESTCGSALRDLLLSLLIFLPGCSFSSRTTCDVALFDLSSSLCCSFSIFFNSLASFFSSFSDFCWTGDKEDTESFCVESFLTTEMIRGLSVIVMDSFLPLYKPNPP
ncbi:hypothetical protein D3C81_1172280 [compost metagenome]